MKLAAILIETRNKQNILNVINNHMSFLPKDTDLFLFHGKTHSFLSAIYPEAHLKELISMSLAEYNQLLTSPTFWEQFLGYDRVLIFQTDSALLRTGIEEFYEYDWVGSAWKWQMWGSNGGLSLRNPKVMYSITSTFPKKDNDNEDVYFCNNMKNYPTTINMAPRDVCMKFGTEAVFALGTLGYHAIDSWLTPEDCIQIKNQYK